MQDRQYDAIGDRVQELVGMPAGGEGPCFGLAIADNAGDDEIGVVVGGAVRVRDSVPQLPALMYRAWRLRRHVTRNAAWERKLLEKALHTLFVRGDIRVNLAVGTLEVCVCNQARPPMSWACDIDHVKVVLLD